MRIARAERAAENLWNAIYVCDGCGRTNNKVIADVR
jgi:hypothetical protein